MFNLRFVNHTLVSTVAARVRNKQEAFDRFFFKFLILGFCWHFWLVFGRNYYALTIKP